MCFDFHFIFFYLFPYCIFYTYKQNVYNVIKSGEIYNILYVYYIISIYSVCFIEHLSIDIIVIWYIIHIYVDIIYSKKGQIEVEFNHQTMQQYIYVIVFYFPFFQFPFYFHKSVIFIYKSILFIIFFYIYEYIKF